MHENPLHKQLTQGIRYQGVYVITQPGPGVCLQLASLGSTPILGKLSIRSLFSYIFMVR